ncbi:MAG TPA: sigma-70 family RNA polymerase sigma factor [Gemmataceae bacterium]|nr:sigma-70 family RNA polymerase sigma factor [Gemmataceae bacterium]
MADPTLPSPTATREASAAPSDHSLLRHLRGGSEEAATQIYLRYAHRLRALARARCSSELARRVEVDDIVQSVFSSFFRGINQGYYDVPVGEELWKLLLVIALNKIRTQGNYHRAAKRDVRLTSGGQDLDELDRHGHEPDGTPMAILQMVIDETVERLPEQQRQMVVLRIEGYEVAEIAARVGRSKRTVERVLQEFRQQLARTLDLKQEA